VHDTHAHTKAKFMEQGRVSVAFGCLFVVAVVAPGEWAPILRACLVSGLPACRDLGTGVDVSTLRSEAGQERAARGVSALGGEVVALGAGADRAHEELHLGRGLTTLEPIVSVVRAKDPGQRTLTPRALA
jgi:hypothetical protein